MSVCRSRRTSETICARRQCTRAQLRLAPRRGGGSGWRCMLSRGCVRCMLKFTHAMAHVARYGSTSSAFAAIAWSRHRFGAGPAAHLVDLRLEAEVEHAVGLVEHKERHSHLPRKAYERRKPKRRRRLPCATWCAANPARHVCVVCHPSCERRTWHAHAARTRRRRRAVRRSQLLCFGIADRSTSALPKWDSSVTPAASDLSVPLWDSSVPFSPSACVLGQARQDDSAAQGEPWPV
jgi:hypothetical protein